MIMKYAPTLAPPSVLVDIITPLRLSCTAATAAADKLQ